VVELLPVIDLLLIMTVNPGYGGQSLIPGCLRKVEEAVAFRRDRGLNFLIEIDGGVNLDTAAAARNAGVDVLVSGSSFFAADDHDAYVATLKGTGSISV
jgi:ribulose-phosphate 3-epimerase